MKNFKTTIAGLLVGLPTLIDALLTAYNTGAFDGKNTIQLISGIGVILLGWLAADKKKNVNATAKEGDGAVLPNKGL